jgi:hypothetical protein
VNPAKTSLPRERQSIWCCDLNYQRWRFVGKPFPGTHHAHCIKCGEALRWTQYRKIPARKIWRNSYERRRDRFLVAGLSSRGGARRRALLPMSKAERLKRMRERYGRLAKQWMAAGLTTRGKERIYRPRGSRNLTPQEITWRELRATMNIELPDFLTPAERAEAA